MDVITSNLGWFSWIIFGALAGWIASILTGRNSQQGCLMNIIVGIVGAFLGGWGYTLITGRPLTVGPERRGPALLRTGGGARRRSA